MSASVHKLTVPQPVNQSNILNWIDKSSFTLRGHSFTVDLSWIGRAKSDEQKFVIVKNKTYIDSYFEQLNSSFKNIVEVGFFEGGSSVFLDLFYTPNKLICVDRRTDVLLPIESYIKDNNREENFKMVYGFDQADSIGWKKLFQKELPEQKLDLIVDDASHQYHLTKSTFASLFPKLRTGGVYVIEDYGWAHDARYQGKDHGWYENPALTNLLFELTMLAAGRCDIIKSIYINRGLCFIEKGSYTGTEELFNINEHLNMRDRTLTLI